MSEEYKDWLDKFEKGFFERRDDRDRARFSKLKSEIDRQKRIEHDSDYNMGRIAIRLKLKISRENLFMDDITREELK